MSISIQDLAEKLKPGQTEYDLPDTMPARVVTKNTMGYLSLAERPVFGTLRDGCEGLDRSSHGWIL